MGNKTSKQNHITCDKKAGLENSNVLKDNLPKDTHGVTIKRTSPIKNPWVSGTHIDQLPNMERVETKHRRTSAHYTQPFQKGKYYPEQGKITRRSYMQSPLNKHHVPFSGIVRK